jgi:RimJ/RimL family protein N-acetyltransferase
MADRWPDPRVILARVAENYALVGDPDALAADELSEAALMGFVEAPQTFEPLLRAAYPTLAIWPRVILALSGTATPAASKAATEHVRRLEPTDAGALAALAPDDGWIAMTWGGPSGLATSRQAWGAFADGRLVSVACSFFVGERFEDIGVATAENYRGRGLALACARGLSADIRERGRRPSWTTSPDNLASLRVAEKLGFAQERTDRLLVVGRDIPTSARLALGSE